VTKERCVFLDGGEKEILDQLKDKYINSGWSESNFHRFTNHDFEEYYPLQLQNIEDYIKIDGSSTRKEFSESAKEVIEILQSLLSLETNNS
jgi:hypothetical protein